MNKIMEYMYFGLPIASYDLTEAQGLGRRGGPVRPRAHRGVAGRHDRRAPRRPRGPASGWARSAGAASRPSCRGSTRSRPCSRPIDRLVGADPRSSDERGTPEPGPRTFARSDRDGPVPDPAPIARSTEEFGTGGLRARSPAGSAGPSSAEVANLVGTALSCSWPWPIGPRPRGDWGSLQAVVSDRGHRRAVGHVRGRLAAGPPGGRQRRPRRPRSIGPSSTATRRQLRRRPGPAAAGSAGPSRRLLPDISRRLTIALVLVAQMPAFWLVELAATSAVARADLRQSATIIRMAAIAVRLVRLSACSSSTAAWTTPLWTASTPGPGTSPPATWWRRPWPMASWPTPSAGGRPSSSPGRRVQVRLPLRARQHDRGHVGRLRQAAPQAERVRRRHRRLRRRLPDHRPRLRSHDGPGPGPGPALLPPGSARLGRQPSGRGPDVAACAGGNGPGHDRSVGPGPLRRSAAQRHLDRDRGRDPTAGRAARDQGLPVRLRQLPDRSRQPERQDVAHRCRRGGQSRRQPPPDPALVVAGGGRHHPGGRDRPHRRVPGRVGVVRQDPDQDRDT